MSWECREHFPHHRGFSNPSMHHGKCVTHVPWCMPGSLTSCFLWSHCWGKRSQHSRRMCNSQFYVSGKRPIHMRAIPQEMLKLSTLDMRLNSTNLSFQIHLPGTNELKQSSTSRVKQFMITYMHPPTPLSVARNTINPLCAKSFWVNVKIFFHFVSLLDVTELIICFCIHVSYACQYWTTHTWVVCVLAVISSQLQGPNIHYSNPDGITIWWSIFVA